MDYDLHGHMLRAFGALERSRQKQSETFLSHFLSFTCSV
jgi:hypothetical protein